MPRPVDTAAIADADLVGAVLDECHRPIRGGLERIVATVRLPDATEVKLFARLPDRLRTATDADRFLLVGDAVSRVGDGTQPAPSAAEIARVRMLCALLDGAVFGPLHRATDCRRLGPSEFEVTQPAGPPWRVMLRKGTLLPDRLVGAAGEVRILDYLRTSTTWMSRRVEFTSRELGTLGPCEISFELADLDWDADFFTPATARERTSRPTMQIPLATGAEPRSATPFLVEGRALRHAVVRDPGTWPERAAAYRPLFAEAERQNQQIAGFPLLFHDADGAWLVLPFRRRPDGPAFAAPADWTIRDVPDGRWLVVYPRDGDFATKVAAGEKALAEALAQAGLTAAGPIVAQPFLRLEEGVPPPAKLDGPAVRMSVAVR